MQYDRRHDDDANENKIVRWFSDKVLPSLAIGIIIGLFSMYIRLGAIEQTTRTYASDIKAYRTDTSAYRSMVKAILKEHTTKINDNGDDLTRLQEKSNFIIEKVRNCEDDLYPNRHRRREVPGTSTSVDRETFKDK